MSQATVALLELVRDLPGEGIEYALLGPRTCYTTLECIRGVVQTSRVVHVPKNLPPAEVESLPNDLECRKEDTLLQDLIELCENDQEATAITLLAAGDTRDEAANKMGIGPNKLRFLVNRVHNRYTGTM